MLNTDLKQIEIFMNQQVKRQLNHKMNLWLFINNFLDHLMLFSKLILYIAPAHISHPSYIRKILIVTFPTIVSYSTPFIIICLYKCFNHLKYFPCIKKYFLKHLQLHSNDKNTSTPTWVCLTYNWKIFRCNTHIILM